MGLCTWRSMVGSAFGSIYVVFFFLFVWLEKGPTLKRDRLCALLLRLVSRYVNWAGFWLRCRMCGGVTFVLRTIFKYLYIITGLSESST